MLCSRSLKTKISGSVVFASIAAFTPVSNTYAAPTPHHVAKSVQAAPTVQTIPETGTLNNENLISIAEIGRAKTDEFSEDQTGKYVGREFSFDIPINSVPDITYDYDSTKHILKIYPLLSFRLAFQIASHTNSNRSYTGENAYGARNKIVATNANVDEVVPSPSIDFKIQQIIEPKTARELMKSGRLKVEGEIVSKNKSPVECGSSQTTPTMQMALDFTENYCKIAAKIRTIAAVDLAGNVIGQWAWNDFLRR